MDPSLPPTIAVVLPPREEFGPRRARGLGLMVRHHAIAEPHYGVDVFGGRQSGPVFLDVTFRSAGLPFFVPASLRIRYVLSLISVLRKLRPVLIEVHAEPAIALRLQRAFPAIPVALFLHDDPAGTPALYSASGRGLLLARTARVLVLSDWQRQRFLEGVDPVPGREPAAIPPSVDFDRLPVPAALPEDAGLPSGIGRAKKLLFVGRLVPEKGAERFAAACKDILPFLPAWRAEMIGAAQPSAQSPETGFTQMLRSLAEPAGIGLVGYRDHPDVMAAMAQAAIVVVPGGEPDPSGRVVLEAMANGAAVICTREGAVPEIAGDAVLYAGPNDLAAAIRGLATNPARIAALGEAGRARAALFGLRRIARRLNAIRAEIIAAGPPPR